MHNKMIYIYNDGGRKESGYKGNASDCVVRAIAIATDKPYQEVYDAINEIADTGRNGSRKGKSNSRTGVWKELYRPYLESLGWHWTPTMQIGQGCKVHLKDGELPKTGRFIVSLSRHLVVLIDNTIQDTSDPSRGGTRCVYGYFEAPVGFQSR